MESWEGNKEKQSYTHVMTRNASVSYTWAFQRTNHPYEVSTHTHRVIYTLQLRNTHTHIVLSTHSS